eukprot:2089746-Prymnesium_polylepis.1
MVRSPLSASSSCRGVWPCERSSAATVSQRSSASERLTYACSPNSESRPASSCEVLTRSEPCQRMARHSPAVGSAPSAMHTITPRVCEPS